nr:MAG TPA: hypothetical protein [Caudoviricetes sp.]
MSIINHPACAEAFSICNQLQMQYIYNNSSTNK